MPGRHPTVSKFELYQTADQWYDSSDYGHTANSLLRYKTQLLGRGHVWTQQGNVFLSTVCGPDKYALPSATPEPAEIAAAVRVLQPTLPYALKIMHVSSQEELRANAEKGIRLFDIEQGDIARSGLATFLEDRQYTKHTLRGSLGKALDVLGLVAGSLSADAIDPDARSYDGEYVSYAELMMQLDQSSLGRRDQRQVIERIGSEARAQLRDMQPGPTADGEFLFEGAVVVGSGRSFAFEHIARTSLGEVLPRRLAADSPVAAFLHETYGA